MPTSHAEIAKQTGLSESAVTVLHDALVRGRGSQAQFDHPELGGMGQWMRGGMVMIGDMFNSSLSAKVSQACALLSEHEDVKTAVYEQPRSGWPAELGRAAMNAGQNEFEYAYFPDTRRLAVRQGGTVTLHDVGDERVRGLSAQNGTLVVQTSAGRRALSDFPVVGGL